jgi:DNA-binding CsgD family transcriptional regulator
MGDTAGRTNERTSRGEPALTAAGTTLSNREREIMAMLADGASGAEIAERLTLSPQTVRTHIRNAMSKLSASSRAQAVALAVKRREIDWPATGAKAKHAGRAPAGGNRAGNDAHSSLAPDKVDATLAALLPGIVSLYEVEGGAIFVADEGGLSLRRSAMLGHEGSIDRGEYPERVRLGKGPLGRAALRRRANLVHGLKSRQQARGRTTICAPMIASGTLVGVICLTTRPGKLVGRSELLLLQAFANRVGEVLLAPDQDQRRRLQSAFEGFRASSPGAA